MNLAIKCPSSQPHDAGHHREVMGIGCRCPASSIHNLRSNRPPMFVWLPRFSICSPCLSDLSFPFASQHGSTLQRLKNRRILFESSQISACYKPHEFLRRSSLSYLLHPILTSRPSLGGGNVGCLGPQHGANTRHRCRRPKWVRATPPVPLPAIPNVQWLFSNLNKLPNSQFPTNLILRLTFTVFQGCRPIRSSCSHGGRARPLNALAGVAIGCPACTIRRHLGVDVTLSRIPRWVARHGSPAPRYVWRGW
jgi:hypothetical protein